jgi:hypothetical protein
MCLNRKWTKQQEVDKANAEARQADRAAERKGERNTKYGLLSQLFDSPPLQHHHHHHHHHRHHHAAVHTCQPLDVRVLCPCPTRNQHAPHCNSGALALHTTITRLTATWYVFASHVNHHVSHYNVLCTCPARTSSRLHCTRIRSSKCHALTDTHLAHTARTHRAEAIREKYRLGDIKASTSASKEDTEA